MACPHVAGAVASLRSVNPTLTTDEVTEALLCLSTKGEITGLPAQNPNKFLFAGAGFDHKSAEGCLAPGSPSTPSPPMLPPSPPKAPPFPFPPPAPPRAPCSKDCLEDWHGDGVCDHVCNTAGCNFDNGDCPDQPSLCSEGPCLTGWPGNGICDDVCNNEACNYGARRHCFKDATSLCCTPQWHPHFASHATNLDLRLHRQRRLHC